MGRNRKGGGAAAAIKDAQQRADEDEEPDYGRVYGDAHDEDDLVRTDVRDFQALREKDPGENSSDDDDDGDDAMAVLGLEGFGEDEDEDEDEEDIGDDYSFERHGRGDEGEGDDEDEGEEEDTEDDNDVVIPGSGDEEEADDETGRGPKIDLAKLRKYADETGEELLLPTSMDYINKIAGYDEHRDIMDRKDPQAAEEAFLNKWGSSKEVFYGTNYVDHDFDHDKDELEEAKLEADEAMDTQMRQAEALNEADFDAVVPAAAKDARNAKPSSTSGVRPLDSLDATPLKMKRDLPQMDDAEKRRHLRRALPEFARHTQFMQEQVQRLRTVLDPLMTRLRKLSLTAEPPHWADYVRFQHNLATAYTTNVLYLIYAQARGTLTRTHPCYTACSTLRSGLEATSSTNIDARLSQVLTGKGAANTVPATAAEAMGHTTLGDEGSVSSDEDTSWSSKKSSKKKNKNKKKDKSKAKKGKKKGVGAGGDDGDDDENEFEFDEDALNKAAIKFYKRAEQLSTKKHKKKQERREEAVQERLGATEDGSRAVSRDIQRNKGLLPSRKKEYRNPRVRQKKRFQRAQKKRRARFKEAVREVPHYQGEKTGIKRSVIKSVKLQ